MRRHFLYALILILVGLAILEGTARLAEGVLKSSSPAAADRPGWQAVFFGSMFDWHESDPDLLWRFRAGIQGSLIQTNAGHLLGPEVPKAKGPQSYRLLLLGDSSPVGMGLPSRNQAFGELTRYQLDRMAGGRKTVELVNAAVSGYSSAQVERFLTLHGWDYQPDVVIVYCGNNDASLSGQYTDRELLERQRFRSIRAVLAHLATYRLLRSMLQRSRAEDDSAEPVIRVSPDEYERNLRSIIAQCKAHACPVIILKPPVPRLWPAGLQFKPFLQLTGADGQVIVPDRMAAILKRPISYCLDAERFRQLYGRGDIFTRVVFSTVYADTLPPEQAAEYYREQAERQPDDPVAVNNLGVARWRLGRYADADGSFRRAREMFIGMHAADTTPSVRAAGSPFLYNRGINLLSLASGGDTATAVDTTTNAFACLDSALQADYFSLRIKRPYWEVIDRLARQPGVTVIDVPRLFRENGGERLFFDHCHPTAEGHRLIAQAIVRVVASHGP